ncbi:phage protein Gp36 family protein [Bacteroides sp.]
MANFIQEEDYEVQARQEMLCLLDGTDERSALMKAERFAISQIRKYIGGRYDCDTLFSATGEDRDAYIVMITIDIVIYHLWAKKAPKSIPTHRKERYSDVLDWLTNVGSGEMPTDLPQLSTDDYKGDVRISSRYKPNDNKY